MACVHEESFGPVLTVETFTSEDEAVAIANDTDYGLAGGVFTEHLGTIDVVALDDRSCLVLYSSDAAPATMAVVLGGATEAALAELARQLEAESGPAVDAAATVDAAGGVDAVGEVDA